MASDQTQTTVITFRPRSYKAKGQTVLASGFQFDIGGTLDGWIDFAITHGDGSHLTYQITRDDARSVIASIHAVIDDITANCLFDRDPLLEA